MYRVSAPVYGTASLFPWTFLVCLAIRCLSQLPKNLLFINTMKKMDKEVLFLWTNKWIVQRLKCLLLPGILTHITLLESAKRDSSLRQSSESLCRGFLPHEVRTKIFNYPKAKKRTLEHSLCLDRNKLRQTVIIFLSFISLHRRCPFLKGNRSTWPRRAFCPGCALARPLPSGQRASLKFGPTGWVPWSGLEFGYLSWWWGRCPDPKVRQQEGVWPTEPALSDFMFMCFVDVNLKFVLFSYS